MTPFVTWLLIIGAFIVLGLLWGISVYNGLVRSKNLADEGWSGIDVQLKRRYDLIPNLVSTVKGYSIHEKEVLEKVTSLRSAAMHAQSIDEKAAAENMLSGALKTLFAVSENYPDLKANQNFLHLQKELSAIEQDIQLARRYYNGAARNYNISIQSFPGNIVAKIFSFNAKEFFETQPQEKNAPKVTF